MPKARSASPSLRPAEALSDDGSYDRTSSPDGSIESSVLLHSRRGIRAELNLHRCELLLWISPQAGKSVDNRFRNFSCRDDHTSLFDRIALPELKKRRFLGCDYDPFHLVLRFDGQTLHLATLLDEPAVLLWANVAEVVDLKTDKQDAVLTRTDRLFAVRHPDRGLTLDFAAALSPNGPGWVHQQNLDTGRSTYARTVLAAGQVLVFAGELSKEKVPATATKIARTALKKLLDRNEKQITRSLGGASIRLRNEPDLQRLYEVNRRHLLSVQDASGAIRAALKYVYYLIWATDGSVTSTSMAQTGWSEFLRLWMEFLLANPTEQQSPPKGPFYGQLVNRRITKREEFGSLCAVWPAFMYWGLTGDDRFVRGRHRKLLEQAVAWMDRYCWDAELGAIGTYYRGGGSEDPFFGSHDFGHDAAVGSFMSRNCYAPRHEGKLILRVYEFGMNLNQYNMYLMLSSVTSGAKAAAYLRKATTVERFLRRLLDEDAVAYYQLEDRGLTRILRTPGEPETGRFAVQNQSPAFFMPAFDRLYTGRMQSFRPLDDSSIVGEYGTILYGRLQGLDTEFVDEAAIVQTLKATLKYNIAPSRFIPMPWTMVEVFGAEPGTFHDIRPQAFSAGPYNAAVANLAIRTLPFGVAVRGSQIVESADGFDYLGTTLSLRYRGNGDVAALRLNGKPLRYTLQIPDAWLKRGTNRIEIQMTSDAPAGLTLAYSTVRLHDLSEAGGQVRYDVTGYAQNVLIFRDLDGDPRVDDHRGREVRCTLARHGRHTFVEFSGKGRFAVSVPGSP